VTSSLSIPPQFQTEGFRFVKLGSSGEGLKKPFEFFWDCLTLEEARRQYAEDLAAAGGDKSKSKRLQAGEPSRLTNYAFDDPVLLQHLAGGRNYGIVNGSGPNGAGLVTLDADNLPRLAELVDLSLLPPTLEAGRRGEDGEPIPERRHFHFISDLEGKHLLKDPDTGEDLGDIRGTGGYQVVGPGSLHPSGARVEVLEDRPIATVTGAEMLEVLKPVLETSSPPKLETDRARLEGLKGLKGKRRPPTATDDPFEGVSILDVINTSGFKESGGQLFGSNPVHGSDTGHNLVVNPAKNSWWCGRHDTGGGPALWLAVEAEIIDCSEATAGSLRGEKYLQVLDYARKRGIIPDDGPRTEEAEDDGIKCISEEELNGRNLATRPKLSNGLEADNFISEYLEFGAATCDAYLEYHYSGALTLLSVAVGRKLVIKLKQGPIHPNIWSFNLGPSTVSRKSTAIAKMEDMLKVVCPDIAIPKSFSPEALIEFLSECPVAYLVKDEVGQLLASMRKQYMEDVRDFFSEIYDNRDFRRKLRTGKRKDKTDFQITDPYIVQSYATTNTLFREYTTPLDLTSGWLLRFLYFAPNYKKPSMAFEVETGKEAELYGRSLGRFSALHRLFSQIEETEIEIEPEAMVFYQDWQLSTENALIESNDEAELAMWGRLQVYALKLAVLFTVGRSGYQVGDKITLAYLMEAVRQVDEYFLPVGRSVAEEVGRAEQTNLQNKIIGTLERHGGKMKRPALLKSLHVRLKDISEALDALTESEELEVRKEVKEGRKTAIWYLLVNNPNHRNNRNNPNNRNNRLDSTFEPGIEGTIATNGIIGIIATNAKMTQEGSAAAGEIPDPDDYQSIAENLEEDKRRKAEIAERVKTPEEDRLPTAEESEVLEDLAGRLLQNWPGLPEMLLWEKARGKLGSRLPLGVVRSWLRASGYIKTGEKYGGGVIWNLPASGGVVG